MTTRLGGFPAGRFFCRFLAEQPGDPDALVDDPFWGEDDPPLRFRNIVDLVEELVLPQIDLQGAPFASWVLARLWYLSAGAVASSAAAEKQIAESMHATMHAWIDDMTVLAKCIQQFDTPPKYQDVQLPSLSDTQIGRCLTEQGALVQIGTLFQSGRITYRETNIVFSQPKVKET